MMSECQEVHLRDVVDTANTGLDAIQRAPIVEYDTGIKCLRIQDVSQNKEFASWGFTAVEQRNYEKFRLRKNDILVARTGASIGVNKYINEDYSSVFNNGLIRIRLQKEKCDPKFLFYNFQSENYSGFIESISGGTSTQPNMQINALLSFAFNLPAIGEQTAIAGLLSSLDNKIALLHRQNKTLEAMAEALFRQEFVESDNLVPITQFVDFNPSRKLSKGILAPYLDMARVSTSTFCPSSWYDREFTSGTKFVNGDTLLARITPCLENGKTAYVTFLEDGQVGWGSTEFIVMRSQSPLSPFFTYALARNLEFREYAEGCMAGSSGRQRVDVEHLKKFQIGAVSTEAISEFNLQVDSIPPKLHLNMLQIRTLEKLRDSLLPKLMSGEVRVQYD